MEYVCVAFCAFVLLSVVNCRNIQQMEPQLSNPIPHPRDLIRRPLNIHSLVGGTVVFPCEVTDPPPSSRVLWYDFPVSGRSYVISDNERVLQGHPNSGRFRIIHDSPTQFHLELRDIRLEDAGTYVCEDFFSGHPDVFRGQAELIVIERDPECSTTLPEDGISFEFQTQSTTCRFGYTGRWQPAISWVVPYPATIRNFIGDKEIISLVEYSPHREMDTRAFSARTFFKTPDSFPQWAAVNDIDYEHLWFHQVFVRWPPTNVTATPIKPVYNVGDQITCRSDAFPDPSYSWSDPNDLTVSDTDVFTVTDDMVGSTTSMMCRVQITIREYTYYNSVSVEVYVE